MSKLKDSITFLHFTMKLAWWMSALVFLFLMFPAVAGMVDDFILSTPSQEMMINLWPFTFEVPLGFDNHDIIKLIPLWFLLSSLGFVGYHYFKTIKWIKGKPSS